MRTSTSGSIIASRTAGRSRRRLGRVVPNPPSISTLRGVGIEAEQLVEAVLGGVLLGEHAPGTGASPLARVEKNGMFRVPAAPPELPAMRQRSTPAGFLRSRSSSSPVPSTASPAVPTRCTACPCWSRAASLRWPCSLVPSFSVAARMTTVTVMMRELLPLRRRGRPDRALPDCPCPPSQDRRRGPGHRPGPQRGRRPARRRGPRSGRRARPDLVAGPQRAAGVRSHRGEHRGPRRRAGASDPDGAAQGRQDRHHPAGAAHGPGRGPRGRRTLRRTDLHHSARWLPRPSRRGSDRPTGRPAGRDHQADRPPHTAALDTDVPLRDVQEAASHADPRTTMRHDRARVSLDRHATYIAGNHQAR